MNYPYRIYKLIGPDGQVLFVRAQNAESAAQWGAEQWGVPDREVVTRYRKTILGPVPQKEYGKPLEKSARQMARHATAKASI